MTPSARSTILASVAAALRGERGVLATDYNSIERTYERIGNLERNKALDLFAERLLEYGAGVSRCDRGSLGATVSDLIQARGKTTVAVPKDIPREWLLSKIQTLEDDDLTFPQLELCDGALTGCAAAIADTGTIILDGTSSQGRRALTLLPDYHLCIVFENQVFQTVPQAMEFLSEAKARPLTFISGPSATADIEMTRIQGVHGPRSMDVILVS